MEKDTASYWNKTEEKAQFSALNKDIKTDILIIGGGISGITCAYCLAQKGAKPVLIEAGGICDGTTGSTTGKVTIQHNIIYSRILDKHGIYFAEQYAESQTKAVEFIKEQVKNNSIDCQLTGDTSYIYASSEKDANLIRREYQIVQELGISAQYIENSNFPPDNFGMIGFKNQAVFHPVRYVNALACAAVSLGADIYTGTKAIKVEDGDTITVTCENDVTIKTKHLVSASQYPIFDGPNIFYMRLFPKRAYGIAVKAKRGWPEGSYINVGEPVRSIRSHVEKGERILMVVGDNHVTARGQDNMDTHYENLVRFAEQTAGVDKLLAKWSAQDYCTPDDIPYIGRISDNSNIYVACGFGKWGLSSGTLAGNMIAELIEKGNCRYEELYSRERKDYSKSVRKTVSKTAGFVGALIKSKFEGTESIRGLKPGEGREINFEGKKAGIYLDDNDNATILDINCTHMGTTLNFNSAEKSWDCPAHGGRFSAQTGKLLEGPPKDSLKILYQGSYSNLTVDIR